jgi:hypothetical protein
MAKFRLGYYAQIGFVIFSFDWPAAAPITSVEILVSGSENGLPLRDVPGDSGDEDL